MKAIALLILFYSGVAMANKLNVEVQKIEPSKGGNIIVFLYSEKGFPKVQQRALQKVVLPAKEKSVIATFEDVPDEFAIKVLHDEDEDGEVTKNWTGIIPAEGLGFSNDQTLGAFGPPKYKACKLSRDKTPEKIQINIEYP
jgi:uncharacterized protein (DUF2141 family)